MGEFFQRLMTRIKQKQMKNKVSPERVYFNSGWKISPSMRIVFQNIVSEVKKFIPKLIRRDDGTRSETSACVGRFYRRLRCGTLVCRRPLLVASPLQLISF